MATVYGDNSIFETIRTAFYDQLELLKTAMEGAGSDPLPLAVYNRHEIIKTTLPAYSVDILSIEKGETMQLRKAEAGGIIQSTYFVACSIRAHTDFFEGYRDTVKIAQLLNSVNNWFEIHRDLNSEINVTDVVNFLFLTFGEGQGGSAIITLDDEFEESLTIGGTIAVTAAVSVWHTQV